MHVTSVSAAALAALIASSGPRAQDPSTEALRAAIADIERRASTVAVPAPVATHADRAVRAAEVARPMPPRNAAAHAAGVAGQIVQSGEVRVMQETRKARASAQSAAPVRAATATLSFVADARAPQRGIDARINAAAVSNGTRHTYGFLVVEGVPGAALERELAALGFTVLGRHDDALKLKVPLARAGLEALARTPGVHSLSYAAAEQKLSGELTAAVTRAAGASGRYPALVTVFEHDADGAFAQRMRALGVTVGRYDRGLEAYAVVASAEQLRALAGEDFVLFIELERRSQSGHDQSMPTGGIDYVRAAGFSGAATVVGILDSGFMMGAAAATMHNDLNKNGCGANFTTDAAGVWNDENGHGTHVLGTIAGTGAANSRFRGAATSVGTTNRIRAGKIWTSAGVGQNSWMRNAMDFMGEASACDAPRPAVVNISGGAQGVGQIGTDAESRKLDEQVWSLRQAYIVCGGNSGPGAQTIWSPGVAKNALAVGNVSDNTFGVVGEIVNSSSRGPTGDNRMKPNLVTTGAVVQSARAGSTDQYRSLSGCSMATPHVTGIAATLLEHYPDFRGRPHLLRAHLMASSVLHGDETAPADNTNGGRNDYGLGRVSAYQAHWAHPNASGWTTHWRWWDRITDSNWGYWDLEIPHGTRRLVAVMTWDEPPASAGAARAVTYDLDLWADFGADCAADGKGQCGERASQSNIDNTEYLIIDNPPPGIVRLKVVNWNAPASGVPAAIAAKIIRGDPTPPTQLSALASATTVAPGATFTVTTRVSNTAYEAYGVHLQAIEVPAGVTLLDVSTRREDGVDMSFGAVRGVTLGSIVQGDSRTARWRFRVDTAGAKALRFRSWSDNGGTNVSSVTVNP